MPKILQYFAASIATENETLTKVLGYSELQQWYYRHAGGYICTVRNQWLLMFKLAQVYSAGLLPLDRFVLLSSVLLFTLLVAESRYHLDCTVLENEVFRVNLHFNVLLDMATLVGNSFQRTSSTSTKYSNCQYKVKLLHRFIKQLQTFFKGFAKQTNSSTE